MKYAYMKSYPKVIVHKGGKGSGHKGHRGIPGHRGGSLPDNNSSFMPSEPISVGMDELTTVEAWDISKNPEADIDYYKTSSYRQQSNYLDQACSSSGYQGYRGDWSNASLEDRGLAKDDLIKSLAEKTGLSYDAVNEVIKSWADTSNNSYLSATIQRAVAEEFGLELSEWQNNKFSKSDEYAELHELEVKTEIMYDRSDIALRRYFAEHIKFIDDDQRTALVVHFDNKLDKYLEGDETLQAFGYVINKMQEDDGKAFLEMLQENKKLYDTKTMAYNATLEFMKNTPAEDFIGRYNWKTEDMPMSKDEIKRLARVMYDSTQASFATAGITEVTVFRGVGRGIDGVDVGDTINYKGNPIESWSVDPWIAYGGFSGQHGAVFGTKVSVKNLLCTPVTGFGCLVEGEFVLLDNIPGAQVSVIYNGATTKEIVIKSFPNHKGRPGKRGGSLPRSGSSVATEVVDKPTTKFVDTVDQLKSVKVHGYMTSGYWILPDDRLVDVEQFEYGEHSSAVQADPELYGLVDQDLAFSEQVLTSKAVDNGNIRVRQFGNEMNLQTAKIDAPTLRRLQRLYDNDKFVPTAVIGWSGMVTTSAGDKYTHLRVFADELLSAKYVFTYTDNDGNPQAELKQQKSVIVTKGGKGSGHKGHQGIIGHRGGSLPGKGFSPGQAVTPKDLIVTDEDWYTADAFKLVSYYSSLDYDTVRRYFTDVMNPEHARYIGYNDIDVVGSFKYNEKVGGNWAVSGYNVRGALKDTLVKRISEETGIPYETVNKAIGEWANTSNRSHEIYSLQQAATEEFGVKFGKWQSNYFNKLEEVNDLVLKIEAVRLNSNAQRDNIIDYIRENYGLGSTRDVFILYEDYRSGSRLFNTDDPKDAELERMFSEMNELDAEYSKLTAKKAKMEESGDGSIFSTTSWIDKVTITSRENERKILRSMYEETQRQLKAYDLKEVVLYRGIRNADRAITSKSGSEINYKGNAMESWSIWPGVARAFSENNGVILAIKVPIENILATPMTGFGCYREGEFVVLDNIPGTTATVIYNGTNYEKEHFGG